METLSNELRDLGETCSSSFSKRVYSAVQNGASSHQNQRSSIRGVSVSAQFRTSLQALVADLDCTQPHYIRCIKPNDSKAPSKFMSGEVLKQLRYSGMMEAIRIRREGYALREDHETFFHRFSVLLTSDERESDRAGIEKLVSVLSKRLSVNEADWQIGHSKIFLRRELSEKLERLAKVRVYAAARTIGRFGRHVAWEQVVKFLIPWVRFRLRLKKKYMEMKSASRIVASFRRHKQQHLYASLRRAIVKVQAEQRRRLAVDHVRKLRDPYCDMTFRECKHLLHTQQNDLDEAVKRKDFRTAADLESKV